MAAHPAVHPSEDALRAFALGKVNDSTSSMLMSHLDGCPECCKVIAALSGDDFLDRLRQAQGRSSTPAPPKGLPQQASSDTVPSLQTFPDQSTVPISLPQTALRDLPPELAANQQYEIVRELGRGGMGVVYLAKNKLMDRLEVLKVVNHRLLNYPGAVERFLREIRSAARLSHPNIVGAYSAVQQGELLAFAMEYIEGQDLASLVKAQGQLPVMHACYYVQQAAWGLQHAFEKGMVHRDIKPQNLILARVGKKHIVKVLDFGLAKIRRENNEDTGLTGEGKMLGTPDYVAPEQTLDAAHADIRADIYSLGCTLHYLLSGRPPFHASSLTAILMAHQTQEAQPLNLIRPEVPEELAAVVRKMMAKNPAKRYQTPLEVAQALAPFLKQASGAALAPRVPPSPELSAGPTEAGPASPKTSRHEQPAEQETAAAKSKSILKTPPPLPQDTQIEASIPDVEPRKSGALRKKPPATRLTENQKKWIVWAGLGAGVLLLALLGMWASGMFTEKTPEGKQQAVTTRPQPEQRVAKTDSPPPERRPTQPLLPPTPQQQPKRSAPPPVRRPFAPSNAPVPRKNEIMQPPPPQPRPQPQPPPPTPAVGQLLAANEVRRWTENAPMLRVTFAPDGQHLLCGGAESIVKIHTVASGETAARLNQPQVVRCLIFSSDGQKILIGSSRSTEVLAVQPRLGQNAAKAAVRVEEGEMHLWDWKADAVRQHIKFPANDFPLAVAFSLSDRRLLACNAAEMVRGLEAATGKAIVQAAPLDRLPFMPRGNRTTCVAFSTDARHVLAGRSDGPIHMWLLQTRRDVRIFKGHIDAVLQVVMSADGRLLVSGSADKTLRLWDTKTSREKMVFKGHTEAVSAVSLSRDGSRVLSGSLDSSVRLWDAGTGKELKRFDGHVGTVNSVAISPDGKHAASAGNDRTVRLWQLP
jgi:serine/threonine protein kinase